MANNRNLIDNTEVIQGPLPLERGWPFFGMGNSFQINEGWQGLLLGNGTVRQILWPGRYQLNQFPGWQELTAVLVDTRERELSVSTTGEFTILQPMPVTIDLDLSVEYQISDPRRVALEIHRPLTSLYDRVITAARDAVAFVDINDIRRNSSMLVQQIMRNLEGQKLHDYLGISILNVLVTRIKAGNIDSNDGLGQIDMEGYKRLREWELENHILQNSQMNMEWLIMHRPEIAQQLLQQQAELNRLIIERTGNPNAIMNNPAQLLNSSSSFPNLFGPNQPTSNPAPQFLPNQNQSLLSANTKQTTPDIHSRMREEHQHLTTGIAGCVVKMRSGVDNAGIPNGSYDLFVKFPSASGQNIEVEILCPAQYPQVPPSSINVYVNNQQLSFRSNVVARWNGHYLIEIMHEVHRNVP
jgi:hypothetical protein